MSIDSGNREPTIPIPDFTLPEIIDIKIRKIPFQAPKFKYFESYLSKYNEAIEFLVKTDKPIPVRALIPVLYVGDTPILGGHGVNAKENLYGFLAFEPEELKENTLISFAWHGDPKDKWKSTRFTYKKTFK